MKNGIKGLWFIFCVLTAAPPGVRAELILTHGGTFSRYEESNGAFIRESFSSSEGLGSPVLGPDGRVYATGNGLGQGAIIRLSETTNSSDIVVQYNSGSFTSPWGMAFGTNGVIFAGSANTNLSFPGRILQFDGTNGAFLGELIPAQSNLLPSPSGMAIGPDGWIYVTDGQLGLGRFAPVGRTRESLSTSVVSYPHFGPDGTLYVKSSATVVQRYDAANNSFLPFLNAADFGITNSIVGVFGPDGLYYFADSVATLADVLPSKVYRYNPNNGAFLGVFTVSQSQYYPHSVGGIAFSGAHLSISQTSAGKTLSYPSVLRDFTAEQASAIGLGTVWTPVPDSPSEIGMQFVLTNATIDHQLFFRLRR